MHWSVGCPYVLFFRDLSSFFWDLKMLEIPEIKFYFMLTSASYSLNTFCVHTCVALTPSFASCSWSLLICKSKYCHPIRL